MKVIECEQYSDEWWSVRRGVPTASEFASIITPAKGQLSKSADAYIYRLLGDLYDLEYPRKDQMATSAMIRGTLMEPESRAYYELHRNVSVRQVGFCLTDDGRFGCSPDALVGEDGCLELKNPMPHTHAEWLIDGVLPADYRAQCHGHLIVTGRAWCDFMSYCPGFPPLLVRVEADDFTQKLRDCLEQFWIRYTEFRTKMERIAA